MIISATEGLKQAPLFSIIAVTELKEVRGKKTAECFRGRRWKYRDDDFDLWLPEYQPEVGICKIATWAPSRSYTFVGAVAAVLGVSASTYTAPLGAQLIERGFTVKSLAQVEEMTESAEDGVPTGMCTEVSPNFWFQETGNPKDPVAVGGVRHVEHTSSEKRGWRALIARPDGGGSWSSGTRFMLPHNAVAKF